MTKQTGQLESEIQAQILKWLREHGIFCFKVAMASPNGIPDVICCFDGKFIALEIKRNDRSRVAPLQWKRKEQIEEAGGESYIVWSVDMVKEIFESHEYSDNILIDGQQKAKYRGSDSLQTGSRPETRRTRQTSRKSQ